MLFEKDDYRTHTVCITEAERYEKSLYKGPTKGNKNERLSPQEAWMEIIKTSLNSAPPGIKNFLHQISSFENVPRKEKPFRNFVENSIKLQRRDSDSKIDLIWKHLCEVRQKNQEQKVHKLKNEKEQKLVKTGKKPTESKEVLNSTDKYCNRRKKENFDSIEESVCIKNVDSSKKSESKGEKIKLVSKAIKNIVKKAPDQKIEFKELRKKIRSRKKFHSNKKQLKHLILKGIKKNSNKIKLDGKVVRLI